MAVLNKSERDHLASVIGELEARTSGELRVIIVKRSSVVGHVHMLLWSLLLMSTFLILWLVRHDLDLGEGWWLWPAILVGIFIVSGFLSSLNVIRRFLTSAHDMSHQVWARAEVEFHREGLSDTSAHCGVMLFVSLMERQAIVLADKGISEKVPPHTWDHVVQTIVDGAKNGRWAQQLEQALREVGAYLANHFPAPEGANKVNELSNEIVIKD